MSTSEADFWARIDSEPPRADAPEPPESPSQDSSTHESASPGATPAKDPAAALTSEVVRPADNSGKSKSQRIREFFAEHPEDRNRDAVEALSSYGVTAADVSNVKTQMRKKAEKQERAKARSQGAAARRAAAGRSTAGEVPSEEASARSTAAAPPANEIAMREIETGLQFIESVGGIQRARQIVDLIARIREINMG